MTFGPSESLVLATGASWAELTSRTMPRTARAAHMPYCARSPPCVSTSWAAGSACVRSGVTSDMSAGQPQALEDVGDVLVLRLEEGAELVTGLEGVGPATLLELGLPRVGAVHLGQRVDPDLLVGRRDPGRRDDAAPVGEGEVDARLLDRRHVGQGVDALVARDGQDPDRAGLDLLEELAEAAGAEGDLVAEDRGEQ